MKTIRKLKLSKQWIVVLLIALASLSVSPLLAANRTIKVVPVTGCQVRIKVGSAAWSGYSSSTITKTVADNTTVQVQAQMSSGYNWTGWTGTYTSTNNPYSFTVSKNATLTASVTDSWTENLIAGATYTLTTVSGNIFKVVCSNTSSPNHNKNFTYIGDITSASGNVTINFNNTATIWAKGLIKVTGGTVNMRNANNNIVTLKRNGKTGNLLEANGGKFDIRGNSSKGARFVIDGGAIFPNNDARNVYVENVADFTNHSGAGRLIYLYDDGALFMQNATMQNAYSFDNGGAVCARNYNDTYPEFRLENVTIQACWAPHGSAIMISGNDQHGTQADGTYLKNVLIQYCYAKGHHDNQDAQGGTIRTNGGGRTRMILDNCEIRYNLSGNPRYGGYGGGIYWNASGKPETRITLKNNTLIHDNESILVSSYTDPVTGATVPGKSWGGGIMIESRMTIESAQIYNNSAKLGGGIYMCTYGGTADQFDGNGFNLTIKDGVIVSGNTATECGGGAYLDIRKSNDIGFAPDGTPISPEFKLVVEGGEITNNSSPKGAGVAILDKAPIRHYNTHAGSSSSPDPSYHQWSLEYRRSVSITGGLIQGNYSPATASQAEGAGIYIYKFNDPDLDQLGSFEYTYATAGGAGSISVTATGGLIYDNRSMNNSKNGVGGGLFINNSIPQAPYNSVCTMTVGGNVEICDNKSDGNGAGVYIANGDITINGGTIGKSGHPNISYNGNGAGIAVANGNVTINGGNVDYNQALFSNNAGGNGGAFYLTGGIATISGGSVSYNTADKNGGGFYVSASNSSSVTTINGGANVSYNTAVNGAGAYINQGTLVIQDAATSINHNTASTKGGGVYMNSGTVSIANAQILSNTATSDGGGIFAGGGNVTVTGAAHINNNSARDGGGGYVNNGTLTFTGSGSGIQVSNNTANYSSTTYGNGGGFFVGGGNVNISGVCQVNGNSASDDGGGLYTTGGTVTISGTEAVISNNTAAYWGGGIRAGGNVTLTGGHIFGNSATARGGGVYVHGGTFSMSGGTIGGTTAQGNYTTAQGSLGGGVFMNAGTATLTGGAISGNRTYTGGTDLNTAGKGGGVYMYGGTCTLSGGATIGGTTADYANSSDLGGGIHSAAGVITVKGGKIQRNTATTAGGAIYTNGEEGVVNVEKQTGAKADVLSYIEYNSAPEGGGIYANRGTVNFSDGFIQYNYASEAGGGIYVNDNGDGDYGQLFLRGSANLRRNHVPDGHNGGGVYLKGVITVGEVGASGRIMAQENYAGDEYIYTWTNTGHPETDSIDQVTANNRNNIYLPAPAIDATYHKDVITVIENGISLTSRVGFSVPANYVPVIYCAPSSTSHAYLDQFSTGHEYQYMVFDDTRHYVAVHYSDKPTIFDPDHVYLYGFWSNVVTGNPNDPEFPIDPETFDPMAISTPKELAFFISWVNGLNNVPAHPNANGKLLADIDMSQFGWVPIGHLTNGYTGTFDGNGHTVSGITSLLYREYMSYGFFGKVNGGTIKDLYVQGSVYALEDKEGLIIGGLAAEANGNASIYNTEVQSTITAINPGTIMGGLVGRMGHTGTPNVHSSIGIADMTGGIMGGLVGQLEKGNLFNSFANAKFTYIGYDQYWGGLVAENSGTIENCYVRLRNETIPDHDYFGLLVGQHKANAKLQYCYSLEKGDSRYYASKASGSTFTDYRYYDDNTATPYLYARRDNQVHVVEGNTTYIPAEYDPEVVNPDLATQSDKQMFLCLNNWVSAKNANGGAYTYWQRPTTKVINDDLPVLKMPVAEAVAATTGDPYLYFGEINGLLADYKAASQAIWLYKDKDGLVANDDSDAKLYINEGVVAVPADGATVNAYVGVTLRNTAGKNGANPTFGEGVVDYTDWHMFSSPLTAAPLGVDYHGDETSYHGAMSGYAYYEQAGMPYYRFFQNEPERGFFPSHRYGESYPTSDDSIIMGNYYKEWDFYTYYEPEYHWINFKRNSNDHWHENAHDFQIEYDNEEALQQGRGYLVASREETFLQCEGELTNEEVYIDVTRLGNFSPGYNFLGNPYLAYLDFNAFARANAWIWGGYDNASYAIIDEVNGGSGGYTYYATTASVNPALATRFISPMQGFMVLAVEGDEVEFNTDMRTVTDTIGDSEFRGGDKPAYPLVNLFAFDDNRNRDVTTVELGRPDRGGAKLMRELKMAKCHVYCHYENEDWAIAFTQPGLSEVAIRFESYAEGEYTMKWGTENGEFSYLHLIDNMTGADIDCLSETEYRFASSPGDYRSRFRLVFGYTGVEEPVEGEATTFAYQTGDELVVTGEGTLTMYDVTGRAVMRGELHGVQSALRLPEVSSGVYLLQLGTAKGTKTQKIVIKK